MQRCPRCMSTLRRNGLCPRCGDLDELGARSAERGASEPGAPEPGVHERDTRSVEPDGEKRGVEVAHAHTLPSIDPLAARVEARAHTLPSIDHPPAAGTGSEAAGVAHARTLPSIDPQGFAVKTGPGAPIPVIPKPGRDDDDPLVGELVAGKFLVQGLVGAGGVGRVYRALQVDLGRLVALKLMHPEMSLEEHQKQRFHREARSASSINHPGAAAIHDFGEWQGQLYIAMELLHGESLYNVLLRDFPLPPERLVRILSQVCETLSVAHEQGIVHRDLKPENIMLVTGPDGQEQVKVVDFGLAILVGPDAEARLTREGLITGTPAYMSPEQVRGDTNIDFRSDLYALGVVLYEQLTACPPFSGETVTDLVVKHLFTDPEPPSRVNPRVTIHPAMEALALQALAKEPSERPASAAAFKETLQDALDQIQGRVKLPSRKVAPGSGDRQARAGAAGLTRRGAQEASTPGKKTQPWVLVIDLGAAAAHQDSLVVALRANHVRASGPGSLDDLDTADEAPQYDALVVDLRPDPPALLELLGARLDGGRLAGLPVVVVGPADSFEVMSRCLELGLADYVPATEIMRKLPRALRRLMRRGR